MKIPTLHTAKFHYLGIKGKSNILELRQHYAKVFESFINALNNLSDADKIDAIDLSKEEEIQRRNAIKDNELIFELHTSNIEKLNKMKHPESNDKTFSDYLIYEDKKTLIERIRETDRNTPKAIYIILRALFDNGLLMIINNETIFKAYFNEFGYHKSYDSLKTGLNYYDLKKPDKNNIQNISNMYDYLKS